MYDQFFICRRCLIFFKTRKFRTIHNMVNHRKKIADIENDILISKPKGRKVRSEPYVCDLCSKTFKLKGSIRSHMNCHSQERPLQCTLCAYATKRKFDLKKHNSIHHNNSNNNVTTNDLSTTSENGILLPTKVKRMWKRKCDKCDEILPDKIALRLHIRQKHPKARQRKIFQKCEKCDEPLYSKKQFLIHMRNKHEDFKLYQCEKCNRRFKTNFRLKKHKIRYGKIKIHSTINKLLY
jgi:KRAB domain-containing zinc finger protein